MTHANYVNSISDKELMQAYRFIMDNKDGELRELENINIGIPEYFSMLGFISFGIDAHNTRRFKTTILGRQYARVAYVVLSSKSEESKFADLFV